MSTLQAELPSKLQALFRPSRYKILYGGRGGAKSWGIARALLIRAAQAPLRILCAREFQNSIADSAHALLKDQIQALGLEDLFEVQKSRIIGRNGSEFGFEGLRHNITSVKSWEGADICWVEEAATVSKASWDVLVPTIRKPGSEIWVSFNPELESDETYKRFVANPQPDSILLPMSWRDNPWFPDVLAKEMAVLKERDPDGYLTVWEGHCRQVLDGAVYANEIRRATADGRFSRVPYDATKPVHTFWDLGWADNTSIWLAQGFGFEFRFIDYIQGSQQPLSHYLKVLQERGYVYGEDWIPHDGQAKQLGSGRSIEELLKASGRKVRVVPKLSIADGINAARTIFDRCWFDAEKCADGLQCLRHYRYEVDDKLGTHKQTPLHDWSSHGADAFRYAAIALKEPRLPAPKTVNKPAYQPGGWMG